MHKKACGVYLVQPESVTLEDGQRLGVDGLSVVGPACQDVPPPPVSLSQGDTHGVWQEDQRQQEASNIEGGGSPELVPATIITRHQPSLAQSHSILCQDCACPLMLRMLCYTDLFTDSDICLNKAAMVLNQSNRPGRRCNESHMKQQSHKQKLNKSNKPRAELSTTLLTWLQ